MAGVKESGGMPSTNVVPMVAMVLGADTAIGQRVALSLAINGARLALLGRSEDKDTMEQVARRAACLGCPSVDIHELDLVSAQQPAGGSQKADEAPPNENIHMAVETILSRQGRVDIIVSCPVAPSQHATSKQRNSQQLTVTKTAMELLATTFLAPPESAHRALISIMHSSNREMLDWAEELPQHMAAAAAKDLTGFSGPTAVSMAPEQRLAAAKDVFMAQLLLPEGEDGGKFAPELSRGVAAGLLKALNSWRQPTTTPEQQQQQQQHNLVLHITPQNLPAMRLPADDDDSCVSHVMPQQQQRQQQQQQQQRRQQQQQQQQEAAPSGATGVVAALEGMIKDAANKAMHSTGISTAETAAGRGAAAASPAGDSTTCFSSSSSAHTDTNTESGDAAAAAAAAGAAGILKELVRWPLQASSSNTTTSSSEAFQEQQQQQQQQRKLQQDGAAGPASGSNGVQMGVGEEELLIQQLNGPLAPAAAAASFDAEAYKVTGRNPCPRPGATCAAEPSSATWVKSETPPVTGILLATGSRNPPGLLSRPRLGPDELLKAAVAVPGAVLTPADPHNLEPEAGSAYAGDPARHPSYLVHCFKPFNGETPHQLLSDAWLTPAELFYVRNHLPVPVLLKAADYSLEVSGPGISDSPLEISLDDLKAGRWGPLVSRQALLQCAGNRRSEVAAVKLVEGRAPWNHGAVGNALWTGLDVWRLLRKAGLQRPDEDAAAGGAPLAMPAAQHLVAEGWDFHRQSDKHFEISIPLSKAMDPAGGVMLAWEMNGKELLPDHGYPLRLVVPGYVGTRSVKWLKRLTLAPAESSSDWQQKDYKILPQAFTTFSKADFDSMPPTMDMPVQSAILLPEPGSVIAGAKVSAVWFRGYAWCGGGLPITRVDVSADDGATWARAEIVEREGGGLGPDTAPNPDAPPQVGSRAWSWVKWQLPLQVPPAVRERGGKWRVCCKAFNINCDTQPATIASVWNFRGMCCNAWHYVDLAVLPAVASH